MEKLLQKAGEDILPGVSFPFNFNNNESWLVYTFFHVRIRSVLIMQIYYRFK